MADDLHPFKTIGDALKVWLARHPEHGTIKEFGAKLGIHYSAMRHYFAGHSFPRGDALVKLREVTGLQELAEEPARRNPSPRATASPQASPAIQAPAPESVVLEPEAAFSERNRSLLVALRSWRAGAGVSREDLAARLGCGLRTLDTWLNGEAYPRDPEHLRAITRVTGITFDAHGEAQPASNGSARQPAIAQPPAIQKASESMAALMRDLQPIIRGPPAMRRGLRDVVGREDAGYLKAAIEALYSDEETFQTWKHFAHPTEG